MGIRETLNKNQQMTTIATIAIIVIALGIIIWQMMPDRPARVMTKSYFTTDDGKTYFEDSADKVAPFDKDGKEAVRAHVFQCGQGAPFVGYLEKLDPKVKQRLDDFFNDPKNKGKMMPGQIEAEESGRLVKKPGAPRWVKEMSPAAPQVTTIKCKDGTYAARLTPDMPPR